MAQYINTSLIADNEFWDASTWRRMCRELAGLRGLAPAVHFRNTVNDSDSSQNVDDDRIFHTHTHQKIYVWGVEMCSGGYDTLKIYWRAPSNPPDAQWTLDSGWTLIKGAGAKEDGRKGLGPGQTNPNNAVNIQPGPSPSGNTGTSEATLGGTGTGLSFPQSDPLPDGSTSNVTYFYNQWLLEMKHSGAIYTMAGPSPKYDQGKSYTTLTSNFLRTFLLMKEGYWKFVLDETASPWYNQSLGSPSTTWDSGLDTDWFNLKGRLSPVDYATNPTLYQSLPGHVDASKNSQVASTGVRYRSRFTRSLNVRAFFPEKDLVTGSLMTKVFKTMTPGVATNDYQVDAPYTKVVGYGAEWGSSLQTASSAQWTKFVKTRNSSGQDGTSGFPHTTEITSNERFSNVEWRYTPLFKKRVINRRHLFIDGVTINGGDKFVDGYYSVQGLWEEDPIYVRPDAPAAPGTSFPSGDGQVKGWFVDFRGSVFRNCTFKNIFIGGRDESCWSGVSFVNCKFINCAVNTNGDSILFHECSFIGGYKNTAMFTPTTFHSSAFISCQFLNNDRVFIFSSSKGPVSDNLWWRNIFDYQVNQNGGGSEIFCTEFPSFMRLSAQTYAFDATGTSITSHIVQQHEFSRNLFINNRLHSGLGGIVSSYETFSRANLFYMNTFNDTIKIYAHTPAGLSEDKCLYESWAHNFMHKLSISLDGKTYHHRFICNAVSEPQFSSFKSIDSHYSPYTLGTAACISAAGVDGDTSAPSGQWYCVNTTAMANKAISNVFLNWGNYFMDNHLGPCSIFNGFHHVYDPDFDINKSVDTYWSQNNLWKYVNVAHRNKFNIPFPAKKYGWTDGMIGRLNSDGSDWSPSNLNFTGATSFSPLPFEWKLEHWVDGVGWRLWDETYGGPSGGFYCSQDSSHILSRNECRSIYVKNLSSNVWEKKNSGILYSNETVLSSRPGWSQQIFRNNISTVGLKLNLNASIKTSFDYGPSGAIFTIPNAFNWKNIATGGGFNASIVNGPQFAGINAYSPPYSTTVGGTLCPTGNGSAGSIRFNCQATGQHCIVSNANSTGTNISNYFSASTENFITIQAWIRKFELTQVTGFTANLVAGQGIINVSSTSGLQPGMTLYITSGSGRFFDNKTYIDIQDIINSTQIDVISPHHASGEITFYAYMPNPKISNQMFLGKGASAATDSWDGYSIGINTSGKLLIVTNGGSFTKHSPASSYDLFANQWYFITAIIKIGNEVGDIQGYVNETRVINTSHNVSIESSYNDTPNNLVIGRGYQTTNTNDFYFNGYIGEVYFYDRKLTDSEISTNYHATKNRYIV